MTYYVYYSNINCQVEGIEMEIGTLTLRPLLFSAFVDAIVAWKAKGSTQEKTFLFFCVEVTVKVRDIDLRYEHEIFSNLYRIATEAEHLIVASAFCHGIKASNTYPVPAEHGHFEVTIGADLLHNS